jgi:hypothetical protein
MLGVHEPKPTNTRSGSSLIASIEDMSNNMSEVWILGWLLLYAPSLVEGL